MVMIWEFTITIVREITCFLCKSSWSSFWWFLPFSTFNDSVLPMALEFNKTFCSSHYRTLYLRSSLLVRWFLSLCYCNWWTIIYVISLYLPHTLSQRCIHNCSVYQPALIVFILYHIKSTCLRRISIFPI